MLPWKFEMYLWLAKVSHIYVFFVVIFNFFLSVVRHRSEMVSSPWCPDWGAGGRGSPITVRWLQIRHGGRAEANWPWESHWYVLSASSSSSSVYSYSHSYSSSVFSSSSLWRGTHRQVFLLFLFLPFLFLQLFLIFLISILLLSLLLLFSSPSSYLPFLLFYDCPNFFFNCYYY